MAASDDIIEAAERVFSTFGYEGASMRRIAGEAGVAQALLHYHFQTKEKLFEAIFARRSTAAFGNRGKALEDLQCSVKTPTLEDVLQAFCVTYNDDPTADHESLKIYFQLVTSLGVAADDRSREMVARVFDPVAQQFVGALMKAVPGLQAGQAVWCYLFAVGARMQAQALNGRAERLCSARRVKTPRPFDLAIPFMAAGIRAVVASASPETVQEKKSTGNREVTRRAIKPGAAPSLQTRPQRARR